MASAAQRERLLLAGILVLALVVRLWGIGFGLPNEHARPDERHLIGFTLTMGGNRLNPGFFNYPSFYLYVLLSLYVGYFICGMASGHFHAAKDLIAEYAISPDAFYLIDRVAVVALSTATVALVYYTMKRAAGTRAGFFAALFLALCYLHVRDSHFGTVDVPLTFMCTLAVLLMQRAVALPCVKTNVLAALCVGLAISTKYNGVVLLLPLALMLLWQFRASAAAGSNRVLLRDGVLCALAISLGFVIGTPYSVLDFATFSRDVASELIDKGRTRPALDLGAGFFYHARFTIPHGVGWPMFIAALAGAVAALRSDFRRACLLLGFPLGWYLVVGPSHYIFVRYAVPLAPSICMFAAWGLDLGIRRLEVQSANSLRRVYAAAALAVVLLVTPSVYNLVDWDRLVSLTDTRVLAAEWFEQHVPAGQSVGLVGPQYIRPDLWSSPAQMQRASNAGTTGAGSGLRNELRTAYVAKTGKPTYELRAFQQHHWLDTLRLDGGAVAAPTYVVLAQHPAWLPADGDEPTLPIGYRPIASFAAYTAAASDAVFDRHDAVYVPYANFSGVERPGPNITVYRQQSVEP